MQKYKFNQVYWQASTKEVNKLVLDHLKSLGYTISDHLYNIANGHYFGIGYHKDYDVGYGSLSYQYVNNDMKEITLHDVLQHNIKLDTQKESDSNIKTLELSFGTIKKDNNYVAMSDGEYAHRWEIVKLKQFLSNLPEEYNIDQYRYYYDYDDNILTDGDTIMFGNNFDVIYTIKIGCTTLTNDDIVKLKTWLED